MLAAGCTLDSIAEAVIQPWVDLPDYFESICMLAFGILGGFGGMAARTILGRNYRRYRRLLPVEVFLADIGVGGTGGVTIDTGDVGMGVPALCPVGDHAGAVV